MEQTNEMNLIEELSLNAHPALNTFYYDGWVLQFANGFTNRANSVHILGQSTLPLIDKIKYCETIYQNQNLPTVFKITPGCMEIDGLLDPDAYKVVTKTNIMTKNIIDCQQDTSLAEVTEEISSDWENHYFQLVQMSASDRLTAVQIHKAIVSQTITALIKVEDIVVACGLCVIERGYAGLYNIIVAEQYRKKGYGMKICESLLSRAAKLGTNMAYLQVVDENEKAKNLYTKIGFKKSYQYWYRVKLI